MSRCLAVGFWLVLGVVPPRANLADRANTETKDDEEEALAGVGREALRTTSVPKYGQ